MILQANAERYLWRVNQVNLERQEGIRETLETVLRTA